MKNIIRACFIAICIMASATVSATGLSEKTVMALIEKVDNAATTLNTSAVSDAMSNNAVIVMNIKMQGKEHVMKPTKNEYIAMLQQGWSTYENYKYSKSNVVVKMQGDKAFVTADVKETMTVQGKSVTGESKEEVTIELINGKPLITKIVGYTSM